MTEDSEETERPTTNEAGSQGRNSGAEREGTGRSPTGFFWLLLLAILIVGVIAALFATGLLPFSASTRSTGENQTRDENVTELPPPPWAEEDHASAARTTVPSVPSSGSTQAEVSLETQLLLASLSNQIHQLVGDKRNLTQRVEDAAERDRVLRSVLSSNIVQLGRLNGERVSDNVERYLMGANPSIDGAPARPAQQGPLRVANYTWSNQEQVGGFWVSPGAFARVRIHAGVKFNVDPDSGLVVVVVVEGGTKMPFSEWQGIKPSPPPVERFEISNPEGVSPLYCSFMPN